MSVRPESPERDDGGEDRENGGEDAAQHLVRQPVRERDARAGADDSR